MLKGGSFGRKYQVDQQEQRSLCSCPCRPTAIANQPTRGLSFLFMFAEKVFISHWISWRLRKTLNSLRRHNELQKWCVFVAISATFLSISCFVPWGICNNELFYFQMYYSRLVAAKMKSDRAKVHQQSARPIHQNSEKILKSNRCFNKKYIHDCH